GVLLDGAPDVAQLGFGVAGGDEGGCGEQHRPAADRRQQGGQDPVSHGMRSCKARAGELSKGAGARDDHDAAVVGYLLSMVLTAFQSSGGGLAIMSVQRST